MQTPFLVAASVIPGDLAVGRPEALFAAGGTNGAARSGQTVAAPSMWPGAGRLLDWVRSAHVVTQRLIRGSRDSRQVHWTERRTCAPFASVPLATRPIPLPRSLADLRAGVRNRVLALPVAAPP